MEKNTVFSFAKPAKIGFIWFIPFYFLALIGAYILAESVFPATISKYKIFGLPLSKDYAFNQPLFIHLSIGVVFIALFHFIARTIGVSISSKNSILAVLLSINFICFSIGINIPLLHTTKLWIIKEHLSLTQVLLSLKRKGEVQLYYIMLIFTFLIPILKMLVMAYDIFISKSDGRDNLLSSLLSKWAMLDVLIIGVIVSTIKSGSGIAEMTTGKGLTYFISSILLSLIISTSLPYTKNR